MKFGMLERPTIGVAVVLAVDPAGASVASARIAVGAAAPGPRRFRDAEDLLLGVEAGAGEDIDARAREAGELVARQLAADDTIHGSADYKRKLASVLVRRAVVASVDRALANIQADSR